MSTTSRERSLTTDGGVQCLASHFRWSLRSTSTYHFRSSAEYFTSCKSLLFLLFSLGSYSLWGSNLGDISNMRLFVCLIKAMATRLVGTSFIICFAFSIMKTWKAQRRRQRHKFAVQNTSLLLRWHYEGVVSVRKYIVRFVGSDVLHRLSLDTLLRLRKLL